jgi:SAM-dependent methyltransferase
MTTQSEEQRVFYDKKFRRIASPGMEENIADFYVEQLRVILYEHQWHQAAGWNVLELGVGQGRLMSKMIQNFPDWVFKGVDISENNVQDAKKRGLDVYVDDANSLEKPGVFDMVYGTAILHHMESIPEFFSSVCRVLKSNGVLLIGAEPVFYEFFYILYHKCRGSWPIERGMMNISAGRIQKELMRDFKNIKIYRHGNPFVYFSKRLGRFWNAARFSRISFLNDIYIYAEKK